jgi:peptidoglycan/LPS O-acetylase OafA/YrhL
MEAPHRQRSPWSKIRPDPSFPTVPRKPGLDGLRALAVIGVIVYHLNPAWLPGGFFGVDVFFVVSGYLITSLLVSEFHRVGHIDLRRFWLARARRLLPSVVVMFAVIILASSLFARDALPSLRPDVLFSLLYVVNWWLILHKVSYFAAIGRPPLLLHMWSLSIEEQFYLLWPPALLFLLRRVNLRTVLIVAVVGATVSSVWMGILFHPGLDPSRAYFGTDTHAQGLLIGCALAILVPPWVPKATVTHSARWLLDTIGVVALAGLTTLVVVLGQYSPFDYPWGFVLVDLCAATLIVMVVHPATRLGPLASLSPIRWVGTRSYALYLWHWPIIQLTRPDQDVSFSGWPLLLFRLALMALAAESSHRLVEIPFKRPELWATWRARLRTGVTGPLWAGLSTAVVAGLTATLLLVQGNITPIASLAVGSTSAARSVLPPASTRLRDSLPSTSTSTSPRDSTSTSSSASSSTTATVAPPSTADPATTAPATTGPATSNATAPAGPGTATTTTPTTTPPTTTPPTPGPGPATILASKEPILAIGDSVMLAADDGLTAAFGSNITVDASVGRQVDEGIARLQQYQASGQLATFKTVVIDLGTNGPMTTDLFNQLVSVLQGVPNVVFYNTYDPRSWESTTNDTLAACVPQHPGMIEIDWAAVAPGPGILYPDGIHPTPTTGGNAFAALLTTALS